jgi:hypothetical protein
MSALAQSFRLLTPSLERAASGAAPLDRRAEMRRVVRLGCRVRRPDGRPVGDRILDLSPQGMLVRADTWLDRGASVLVSFQATDLGLWFDAPARVARVVHGRRPGDPSRALALRFDALSAVSRLILRGYLRDAAPVPPHRPPPFELVRRSHDYAGDVRRALEG